MSAWLIAVSWWFLYYDGGRVVRAAGPYPTQEMCRIAGERTTDDRRFWTQARWRDENHRRREKELVDRAAIDKALAKRTYKTGEWIPVNQYEWVRLNARGEAVGMAGPNYMGLPNIAASDCMRE